MNLLLHISVAIGAAFIVAPATRTVVAENSSTMSPNIFRAGTFYQDGDLVFWDVHHPESTIVIELTLEHYAKLIVEVADPTAAVNLINSGLTASQS